jgi:hypothetical protein
MSPYTMSVTWLYVSLPRGPSLQKSEMPVEKDSQCAQCQEHGRRLELATGLQTWSQRSSHDWSAMRGLWGALSLHPLSREKRGEFPELLTSSWAQMLSEWLASERKAERHGRWVKRYVGRGTALNPMPRAWLYPEILVRGHQGEEANVDCSLLAWETQDCEPNKETGTPEG